MKSFDVVILGAGMSGICMAIKLRAAGITDFVMLEKTAGVGGTWHENTYPGACCDVASQLYSYSFEPNPDWSQAFSPQAGGISGDLGFRRAASAGVRPLA